MTLIELRNRIDVILKSGANREHNEVVIPNNKSQMGGISFTKIKYVNNGQDWNSGLIIFTPENEMIEKINNGTQNENT